MKYFAGMLLVIGLGLALAPAPGCSSDGSGSERGDFLHSERPLVELDGHVWQLLEVGGLAFTLPPGSTVPSISFDTESGKASGHAGCNQFFGQFVISGSSLSFEQLGTTRMACPEPLASVEQRFLAALGNTDGYAMQGSELLLLSGSTVLARLH